MSSPRREFIRRAVAASILLATGAVAVWDLAEYSGQGSQGVPVVSLLQTSQSSQQTSVQQSSRSGSQSSSIAPPAGYFLVAAASALNGKTSAYFTHPTQGVGILVNVGGQWKAFSSTCTHAPCTVGYSGSRIQCPCHGGAFDPTNGNVLGGPPPTRLPEFGVIIQSGNLYVSQAVVN